MHYEVITPIVNTLYELHNSLGRIFKYLDKNDKEAYEILFNIFHYSATGSILTTTKPLEDARFINILDTTKRFLEIVFEVYNKYTASLANIAHYVYDMTLSHFRSNKKYILLYDGMSIIEALYIAHKMRPVNFIGVMINPGGVTETYKFIMGSHKYLTRVQRLEEIIRQIAKETGAQAQIFRDYDDAIHRIENLGGLDPQTIIDEVYNITLRLEARLNFLKREGATIMLISDHGYDVVPAIPKRFKMQHKWAQHALSIIAPILVL